MDAGYTNEIFGDLFHALFSRESETNVLAPTKYPSIEEVLEEVHGAGGIAVLAHPAFYDNFDEIEKYIDLGLDGIEVWHPSATEDDVHRLTEICKAHDLLMTGGSDFHGIYGAKTVTLAPAPPRKSGWINCWATRPRRSAPSGEQKKKRRPCRCPNARIKICTAYTTDRSFVGPFFCFFVNSRLNFAKKCIQCRQNVI